MHSDLPGYCAPTFTLMRVGSTAPRSVHVPGFASLCLLTPQCSPLSASCSSRQRFASGFLQTPGHPSSPCRAASISPCRVCRGLSPPSECALPGAQTKRPPCGGPLDNRGSATRSVVDGGRVLLPGI